MCMCVYTYMQTYTYTCGCGRVQYTHPRMRRRPDGEFQYYYGSEQKRAAGQPRSFFLQPYSEIVKLCWSKGRRAQRGANCHSAMLVGLHGNEGRCFAIYPATFVAMCRTR